MDPLKHNMVFAYNDMAKEDLSLVFEAGMIRIKAKNGKNFGTLSYTDGNDQLF